MCTNITTEKKLGKHQIHKCSGTHQRAVVKGKLIGPKSINGEIPAERSKTYYFSNITDGKQVTDPRSSE